MFKRLNSPVNTELAVLCFFIVGLNLLDVFATLRHLEHGAEEANPIMADCNYVWCVRNISGVFVLHLNLKERYSMHFCGGVDDLFFILIYLLMLIPGVKLAIGWLRQKLGRHKKDCCDCHK